MHIRESVRMTLSGDIMNDEPLSQSCTEIDRLLERICGFVSESACKTERSGTSLNTCLNEGC
jgi:hypothetical protein